MVPFAHDGTVAEAAVQSSNRSIAQRAFRRLSSKRQTSRQVEQRGVDRRGAALRLLCRRLAPIRPFPKQSLSSTLYIFVSNRPHALTVLASHPALKRHRGRHGLWEKRNCPTGAAAPAPRYR